MISSPLLKQFESGDNIFFKAIRFLILLSGTLLLCFTGILDLTVSSSWIVRRLSRMNPTILVPVAPDMNSVISLQTVEKFFAGANDGDGRPLQPFYVLNQFDTSLPLHLDVREVMRRQLGERLLPFVIRRAPAVSEALAEGMTVVDYAPDAPVAEDYLNLATWLRTVAAPATAGFRNVRWSER